MRKLLIVIGTIGALASVALCASFGWDQATELKDRITQAFVYGFVALVTLALHVAAIRIYVMGWRKCAVFLGAAAFLAFVMTAFTSLGGMASREDKVVAERQDVLDTKADTKRQIGDLVTEKAGLRFTRTTKAGVDAAQQAAEAAKLAKERECGNGDPKLRGKFCREKEAAEGQALEKLATAQTNKAATDRSIEIDAELKRLRGHKGDSSVGTVNPLRTLLAGAIGMWADMLTSWQKVAFAVIYDICLVAVTIAIEVLGYVPSPSTAAIRPTSEKKEPARERLLDRWIARLRRRRHPPPPVADHSEPAESDPTPSAIDEQEPVMPVLAPKPRLVPQDKTKGAGVAVFLAQLLRPKPGAMVELEECQTAYVASGLRPLTTKQFVESLQHFCRACRIRTKIVGEKVYLLEVELVGSQSATERTGTQRLGTIGKAKRATEPA